MLNLTRLAERSYLAGGLVALPAAVLQRLGDVGSVDAVGIVQVGDGAGDLEDAVVGSR